MSPVFYFRRSIVLIVAWIVLPASVQAAVLQVGPGKKYAMPSQAFANAAAGDTIQIDSAGNYFNDVALIDKSDLTVESTGAKRAEMKTDGRVYGHKAIWLDSETAGNLTIKGIDFEGARVSDADGANGSGLRAQGTNLTVLNCRFYDNQNGILGGAGKVTIEHCEFDHNGLTGLSHNLYISEKTTLLTFRFNYSHDTVNGHLLKSRAAANVIDYNRLSDDAGTGSYEIDLPNGGKDDIIGNIIQQSATSQNSIILAYGEEGVTHPRSELNIVHNTFINDKETGAFIHCQKLPEGFPLAMINNIFAGPGKVLNTTATREGGNLTTTIANAGFVNAMKFDFHLTASSPAKTIGIEPGTNASRESLAPRYEYDPAHAETVRRVEAKPDAGAFEFTIEK